MIKTGENIGGRKWHKNYCGELKTAGIRSGECRSTGYHVFSIGGGMIQLATIAPWTGLAVDVSAPMPAASIVKAGVVNVSQSHRVQCWKPAN